MGQSHVRGLECWYALLLFVAAVPLVFSFAKCKWPVFLGSPCAHPHQLIAASFWTGPADPSTPRQACERHACDRHARCPLWPLGVGRGCRCLPPRRQHRRRAAPSCRRRSSISTCSRLCYCCCPPRCRLHPRPCRPDVCDGCCAANGGAARAADVGARAHGL